MENVDMSEVKNECNELASVTGSVQTVTIQHFHSLKTQEVALIKVVEDDCDWRFPDGSELAYEWSVIDTAQNGEM
jgi:hypothetical protein